MTWEPLLDVTEESMVTMVQDCEPGSVLHRVTQRVVTSLGNGPGEVISAFQSALDDDNDDTGVMVAGFNSAVV